VWALSRLLPRQQLAALAEKQSDEDTSVTEEWAAALH
jgi:hypothetical protein